MKPSQSIKVLLAGNTADRIRIATIKTSDQSSSIAKVTGWDSGVFTGELPDGSLRRFRFIGNAALGVGEQVSVILPDKAQVGWADTKAR